MVALANWALMPKYCPNGHTFQPHGHQGDTPCVIGLGLLQSYLIGSLCGILSTSYYSAIATAKMIGD